MQYLQSVNNNLQRDRSAAHARWNVESAENQTAICLCEDGWTVLVLRSAAIPSRGSRHRGQEAARVYGRPPPSSSPWRAGSREQSACVQILQFAQEFTERRTISAMGTEATVGQDKARWQTSRRASAAALEDKCRDRGFLFRACSAAEQRPPRSLLSGQKAVRKISSEAVCK